jgi:surface protein
MSKYCTSLKTIPALDTSNVTSMDSMFSSCYSLQSIPALDTSKVTSMSYTFENCNSLQYIEGIDFSSLNSSPSGMPIYIKRINVNGKIDFSWTYGLDRILNLDYETIKSFLVAMSKTTTTTAKTIKFNINLLDRGTELRKLVTLCASKGWTITGLTIEGIEYTPEEDENDDLLVISVIDANTNEKVGEFTQTVTSVPNVYSYPFENVTGDFYFVDAQGNYYANPVSKADNIYGKNSSTANVSTAVSYYLNKSQQVIHVDTKTRYVAHICLDDETIRWHGNTTSIPTGTPTN